MLLTSSPTASWSIHDLRICWTRCAPPLERRGQELQVHSYSAVALVAAGDNIEQELELWENARLGFQQQWTTGTTLAAVRP